MKYLYIEPEVAGGLGEHTVMDRSSHPPVVQRLHYRLEGWLGDALLETFPCFIVTEDAKASLVRAEVTGASFDLVEVSCSPEFESTYNHLPTFEWLRVTGTAGKDDFGTAPDGRLVVSERALEILRPLGIANAITTEFPG